MAYDDSPEQEFDPEMERILRDYFAAESAGLRAPGGLWARLAGRMQQPAPPSFFSRLRRGLSPMRNGRFSPVIAVAGMAAAAIALSALVWLVVGGNGGYPDDDSTAVRVVRDPVATAAPEPPRSGAESSVRGVWGPAGADGAGPVRAAPTSEIGRAHV